MKKKAKKKKSTTIPRLTPKQKDFADKFIEIGNATLERQVQRAIYCIEHKNKELSDMFEAETGMAPEAFIDKWEKILL